MVTKQQNETLYYFSKYASDWEMRGAINSKDKFNVIKQRNNFVLKVISERQNTGIVLDIGCGTGDLACEIAAKGINAVGVDFAKEMIEIAKNKARKLKCDKARFECSSIFDFQFEQNMYDVILANGFIEYISYKELDQLLDLSWQALKKGGSLVLGSRNRLLNAISLNDFTQKEIDDGDIIDLLLEAIQIVKTENINDLVGFKTAPLQKENEEREHMGVQVATRYQFTPAQLVNVLREKKFEPIEIFPIHIHGVVPKFKDRNPAIHGSISNFLQDYANNLCLVPQSATFMVHVKKI